MIAQAYLPVLITLLLAIGIGVFFNLVAIYVGPKVTGEVKDAPFESGMPSEGTGYRRYSVRFYMVAMIFLIFDVEVVFLYPWAVKFKELGMVGFVELMVFMAMLVLGLVYAWKKGALEWE